MSIHSDLRAKDLIQSVENIFRDIYETKQSNDTVFYRNIDICVKMFWEEEVVNFGFNGSQIYWNLIKTEITDEDIQNVYKHLETAKENIGSSGIDRQKKYAFFELYDKVASYLGHPVTSKVGAAVWTQTEGLDANALIDSVKDILRNIYDTTENRDTVFIKNITRCKEMFWVIQSVSFGRFDKVVEWNQKEKELTRQDIQAFYDCLENARKSIDDSGLTTRKKYAFFELYFRVASYLGIREISDGGADVTQAAPAAIAALEKTVESLQGRIERLEGALFGHSAPGPGREVAMLLADFGRLM